jgi:hypothetical protein
MKVNIYSIFNCLSTFLSIIYERNMEDEPDEDLKFPPCFLLDGRGLNVSNKPDFLVTLPGDIDQVVMLQSLARLVPLRFFNVNAFGHATCIETPEKNNHISEAQRDEWESPIVYNRRLRRQREKERCEGSLYDFEQQFSQCVEGCTPKNGELVVMCWVIFPTMPKVPRDPIAREQKPRQYRQAVRALELYSSYSELRMLMREGSLDYSQWNVIGSHPCAADPMPVANQDTKSTWRVIPTARCVSSIEPILIRVTPEIVGNYRFSKFPMRVDGEGKVGFVVIFYNQGT